MSTPATMAHRKSIPAADLADALTHLLTAVADKLTADDQLDLDALDSLSRLVDARTRSEAQRLEIRRFAIETKREAGA
ncbi:hypothetical protein PV367_29785 [Streptomyces europaeiscabiei]|uniref:Uncharacterized protein n=1 Tax=Streptomyces europaeiscabiei TaxID=146819 RepID=A0AAJ2PV81_9ACTN|nr:hypothetical protein [Streptomyces europaeiscabiei]MDX3133881.1 hypothetical protein [Streptomyces europaeiscabiei]